MKAASSCKQSSTVLSKYKSSTVRESERSIKQESAGGGDERHKPSVTFVKKRVPTSQEIDEEAGVQQHSKHTSSVKKSTAAERGGPPSRGIGKEIKEKCEKLENLVIHSLKVIEQMAIAMDNVPKAI
jgi:hypothetical protein